MNPFKPIISTRIVVPAIAAGLIIIFFMRWFVRIILLNELMPVGEHAQELQNAVYAIDAFVFFLTIIMVIIFFLFSFALPKRLITRDLRIYLMALESASNHVIVTDTKGVIIYANKGAEIITGYTFAEMKGNTPRLWGALMPPEFYKELWKTIKYDKKTFCAEMKNRRKNQDEYYTFTRISPIIEKGNRLIGFVATEEDITKTKELDNAKSEFISIASHQLRTPISSLSWLIESLQLNSQNLTQKQKEYVENLSTSTKRLTVLVEDLLNFSRVELKAGIMTERRQIPICDFVKKFIAEIELYARQKKHILKLHYNLAESAAVLINDRALANVLQNLLFNAIEYSPENTQVDIRLEQDGNFVKISVDNKGPAIPKDEQAHLFEKFYRTESAKKIKPEGTGLGLYIVKAIIEDIGGQTGFESPTFFEEMPSGQKKAMGASFWFTVPCFTKSD